MPSRQETFANIAKERESSLPPIQSQDKEPIRRHNTTFKEYNSGPQSTASVITPTAVNENKIKVGKFVYQGAHHQSYPHNVIATAAIEETPQKS